MAEALVEKTKKRRDESMTHFIRGSSSRSLSSFLPRILSAIAEGITISGKVSTGV
jgi:hypothetical protein